MANNQSQTSTSAQSAVRIQCVCGREIAFVQELLGRVFPCPYCGRYLRAGLQFLMLDQQQAPNLTAVCTCGRFIVEKTRRAGKKSKCRICGRRVVLPKPVEKEGPPGPSRISPSALEKQLKRARGKRRRRAARSSRPSRRKLRHQTVPERFSLKPGQTVCPNPECRTPLPSGANVCPRCAMNLKVGVRYEAPGPAEDPTGKWKDKWARS
jgi:hypothetical protein